MNERLEAHIERLEVEELVARVFLSLGVLWWGIATLGAFLDGHTDVVYGTGALMLLSAVVLAVGLRYELTAATILVIAAGFIISYGINAGWELGIWIMVGISVLAEMVAGAAMLIAAGEEESVIVRESRHIPMRPVRA